MYRIIKTDGTVIGITDHIHYIKRAANGSFIPTEKIDAIGVAYKSTPYNLLGHSSIAEAETVLVCEFDAGDFNMEYNSALASLDAEVVDLAYQNVLYINGITEQ